MIKRTAELQRLRRYSRSHPVVATPGARQVGKTTLAAQLAREHHGRVVRFDLVDPCDLAPALGLMIVDPLCDTNPVAG